MGHDLKMNKKAGAFISEKPISLLLWIIFFIIALAGFYLLYKYLI